jgi:hypothetical protein
MNNLLLLHHQGLGDSIICNGMVNELTQQFESTTIFCKKKYQASISNMYSFTPKIKILSVENDIEAFKIIEKTKNLFAKTLVIGFNFLIPNSNLKFEEQFYLQANVKHIKKWESFYIGRNFQKENYLLNKAPNNFIFVHDDSSRQMLISDKYLKNKKVFKVDTSITNNIFDYCACIEQASEIHVIDSCFMFLVDCLKYKNPKQKLFVHRYSRFNEDWLLPVLKKNWTIITEK